MHKITHRTEGMGSEQLHQTSQMEWKYIHSTQRTEEMDRRSRWMHKKRQTTCAKKFQAAQGWKGTDLKTDSTGRIRGDKQKFQTAPGRRAHGQEIRWSHMSGYQAEGEKSTHHIRQHRTDSPFQKKKMFGVLCISSSSHCCPLATEISLCAKTAVS